MKTLACVIRVAGCALWILGNVLTGAATAGDPLHEQIDALIEQRLAERNLASAEPASDAAFLRRVYLDLKGVIPTSGQVRGFLDDSSPEKRQRLIDELIASPDYAIHMARVFDVMLIERRIPTIKSYDVPAAAWRSYLTQAFAENWSWDQITRDILASDGTGDARSRSAGVKFALVRDVEPHLLTRDVGRLFLGIDLQCARCHDDPRFEAYRQADYFGIYAFLQRITAFRDSKQNISLVGEIANGNTKFVSVFTAESGETSPRLPGGEMIVDPPLEEGSEYIVKPGSSARGVPAYSRRLKLAELLPRAETRGFSRNIVNRVWAMMLGRGIVEPLDLHHPGNPPSHPELLAALDKFFVEQEFDIQALMREIALSRTYQRSSIQPAGVTQIPHDAFAAARLRGLTPEQFAWSLLQATGRIEHRMKAVEAAPQSSGAATSNDGPPAWKARLAQIKPLDRQAQELAEVFSGLPGQPAGTFQPTVDQALHLLNSPAIVAVIQAPGTLLPRLQALNELEPLTEELYLSVLSRLPEAGEAADVRHMLESADSVEQKHEALTALVWGLLLSSEFRLNH